MVKAGHKAKPDASKGKRILPLDVRVACLYREGRDGGQASSEAAHKPGGHRGCAGRRDERNP